MNVNLFFLSKIYSQNKLFQKIQFNFCRMLTLFTMQGFKFYVLKLKNIFTLQNIFHEMLAFFFIYICL